MHTHPDLTPFAIRVGSTVVRGMRGGEGPAALLIHGTAGSWRNLLPWLPVLVPRYDALLPDLPGFGESRPLPGRPSLQAYARTLQDLASELGVVPNLLVGLGLGSAVALAYLDLAHAAPADQRPQQLILYAPPVWPGSVQLRARLAIRLLASPPLFPLLRALLRRRVAVDWWLRGMIAGPDASSEELALLREDFTRANLDVHRALLMDLLRRDFRPLVQSLDLPTLIVVGQNDPFVDAVQLAEIPSLSPRTRVIVQSSDHGWTADVVAEQRRLIQEFLPAPESDSTRGR